MNRRALLASLVAASVLGARFALAGPPAGVRRFVILLSENSCGEIQKGAADTFVGLAKLGHVEGRNLSVEWHCFGSDFARGAQLAAQLVRRGVDVFFTTGTPATEILQHATKTIPIVTWVADPVASGFTRSLVRPDRNITGFCGRHPDTPAKEVELIRRIAPKTERLVIIANASIPGIRPLLRPYEAAATAAGLVPVMKIVDRSELNRVFNEMKGSRTQFVVNMFASRDVMGDIAGLALRNGVATMLVNDTGYVELGGLVSFDTFHQNREQREVAVLDKLLRGVKPADIPWELPDRNHIAINLRTARSLGLTIPPDVLVLADQIVE